MLELLDDRKEFAAVGIPFATTRYVTPLPGLHWVMSSGIAGARAMVLVVAALATIGCDRVTKHAASSYLANNPDRSFLLDTIRVGYAENTGGFLSLGADLPPLARGAIFTVATGIALVALLGLVLGRKCSRLAEFGLVLFIAGGSSNWIDRVLRGSVVDFLNMGIGPVRTGVFNVADVGIMLGAGLFLLGELRWTPQFERYSTARGSLPRRRSHRYRS